MASDPEPLPKTITCWTPFRFSNVGKSYIYQHKWIAKATPKSLLTDLSAEIVFKGHIGAGSFPRTEHANLRQKFQDQLSMASGKTNTTHLSAAHVSSWPGLDESLTTILTAQSFYPFSWMANDSFDQESLTRSIVMLGNRRYPGVRQDDDNIRLVFWSLAEGTADTVPLVTRSLGGRDDRTLKTDLLMHRDPYIIDVLDVIELTRERHLTHLGEKVVPARRAQFELFALRLLKESNAPSRYPQAIDPGKFEKFVQAMDIERKPSSTPVTLEDFQAFAKEVQLIERLNEIAERLLELLCK